LPLKFVDAPGVTYGKEKGRRNTEVHLPGEETALEEMQIL